MSASRFCENCGATLVAKARFCEACGRAVSAPPAPAMPEVAAPSSATLRLSQPRWLIVGGVAVVAVIACVAVIAVGGFFFFQSTAQGPTKPAPSAFGSPSAPTPLVNTSPLLRTPAIAAATPTIPAQRATTGSQPTYSSVTFSSAFDQSALVPINPGKTFPYGATVIYAYWTYSGVVPDTSFDYDWYRNGAHMGSDGEKFINSSGKSFLWRLHPNSPNAPKIPLDPGNYTFVLRVGGQVILSDAFVIQSPPDTIVVFFSIINDWPVGYVVDKQGLPAEIRKNASGTADLSISRADNWAGTRSDFPSQRYPADPVLRIGLGD